MATRLKTIEYMMPTKATLTDNTLQAMTQMTAYIPEFGGTVTFKSVIFNMTVKEGATTAAGNYTTRTMAISVGGAGATTYTSGGTLTGSGENQMVMLSADATAHFVTNWTTGTSKTIDVSCLVDHTGTTIVLVDVNVTYYITYEYDDTQATQIKTAYIPLDAPGGIMQAAKQTTCTISIASPAVITLAAHGLLPGQTFQLQTTGALPTGLAINTTYYVLSTSWAVGSFRCAATYGGTAINTSGTQSGTQSISFVSELPALDTELPETSKTYRQYYIVLQGNINQTASTTDSTISMQVDALTAATSSSLEMSATSDYWIRFLYNLTSLGMTTNAVHQFFFWGSVARFNHAQAYLVVTYEFSAAGTTDCYNSVLLPADGTMMGGTTSADFQRISTNLWIEEPATITSKRIAFYACWEQAAAIANVFMRISTGTFLQYTDAASVLCGSNGAMVRTDSAFTLARGKNTLTMDVYRSDTADYGLGFSGYWMVSYTSAKPTGGYGAANHTVKWGTSQQYQSATATNVKVTALATTIPETSYFLNGYGFEAQITVNTTGTFAGGVLYMEKSNAAGQWYPAKIHKSHTDAEQGPHYLYNCVCPIMYRWASDPDATRIDPEGTRRWWWSFANAGTGYVKLDIWYTYHTNTFTVSGTLSGYADADGAGLTVKYFNTDGLYLGSSTTTAGGAHTFTWYDNTVNSFASCYENATHVGRSIDSTAT